MKKLLTILFFVSILNTLYSQTITTNTIYRWNNGTGFREMADPPCPAAGYSIVWERTDGHLYLMNDACAIFDLTAGSGGSTITTFGNGLNFSAGTLSLVTQMSITTDASGLKLVGDVTSPGNNKFYKTNGSGVRTWAGIKKADLDDLTIGEVLFGNMAGTGQVEQDPNFYFNGTTDRLSIGDNTPAQPASLFIKGQPAGASYPLYIEDGNAAVHLLSILSNGGGASLWFGSSNATSNLIEIGGQASGSGFTGFLLNHGFGFGATNIWRVGEENATNFVLRHQTNGGGFEIEPTAGDVIIKGSLFGEIMPVDNALDTVVVWNPLTNQFQLREVSTISGGGGGIAALTNGSGTTVGADLTSIDLVGTLTSNMDISGDVNTYSVNFTDLAQFNVTGNGDQTYSGRHITFTSAASRDITYNSGRDILLNSDNDITLTPNTGQLILNAPADNLIIPNLTLSTEVQFLVRDGGGAVRYRSPNAVGNNLFSLADPSAITFLRVNADNSVSALDAATFRTAIGVTSFTDEAAQDAVGGILVSPLAYSDATPSITLAGLSGLGTANQILGMNAAATAYEYKSFAFGAAGTTPAITHTANTITIDIPLAASTVTSGTISNTTQSITGIKTFANAMIINVAGSNTLNVGTTTSTYRTTNGGSNLSAHTFIDVDASNSSAGAQAFGFDDGTTGMLFTAANGTRRILRAAINIASLDNTAASEDADLIFSTQAAGAAASEKFRITNTGNIYGTAIHNNATAPTGTTTQYIASGTYTPTLTGVTNIAASTAYACQWMRVGNVVTVSGKVDIDVTLGVASELGVSLPIASNFAAEQNAGGAGSSAAAASLVTAIKADATNDRAAFVFTAVSVTNDSYFFEFTYVIL